MPDELGIDTDKLHETIHEELERSSGTVLKAIALTTALFAALGAVAALFGRQHCELGPCTENGDHQAPG